MSIENEPLKLTDGETINVQACREWLANEYGSKDPGYDWFGCENDDELESLIRENVKYEGTVERALMIMLHG